MPARQVIEMASANERWTDTISRKSFSKKEISQTLTISKDRMYWLGRSMSHFENHPDISVPMQRAIVSQLKTVYQSTKVPMNGLVRYLIGVSLIFTFLQFGPTANPIIPDEFNSMSFISMGIVLILIAFLYFAIESILTQINQWSLKRKEVKSVIAKDRLDRWLDPIKDTDAIQRVKPDDHNI